MALRCLLPTKTLSCLKFPYLSLKIEQLDSEFSAVQEPKILKLERLTGCQDMQTPAICTFSHHFIANVREFFVKA